MSIVVPQICTGCATIIEKSLGNGALGAEEVFFCCCQRKPPARYAVLDTRCSPWLPSYIKHASAHMRRSRTTDNLIYFVPSGALLARCSICFNGHWAVDEGLQQAVLRFLSGGGGRAYCDPVGVRTSVCPRGNHVSIIYHSHVTFTLRYVILCFVTLRYVTCYVMLCYVTRLSRVWVSSID